MFCNTVNLEDIDKDGWFNVLVEFININDGGERKKCEVTATMQTTFLDVKDVVAEMTGLDKSRFQVFTNQEAYARTKYCKKDYYMLFEHCSRRVVFIEFMPEGWKPATYIYLHDQFLDEEEEGSEEGNISD